jgi:low temperature requirement protein LtrA
VSGASGQAAGSAGRAGSASSDDEVRVSTLELFFDLVFVFTITQLTAVLAGHPDGERLLQVTLMLAVIWWMYDAFAWLTNAMPPDRAARQLFLLAGMAAFFVISLTIPHAFGEDGVAFALAYLVVVAVHAGLYRGAAAWPTLRDVWRFARFNVAIAGLIMVGAAIGDDAAEYALWLVAVAAIFVGRLLIRPSDPIKPSHFIERHGLVVIVALGESVVAVGIGASHGDAVDVGLVVVAVLGLALSACLWWVYFGGDEERAVRAFAAIPLERRAPLSIDAFYYAHGLILLGIVAVAAALEHAIDDPGHTLDFALALALGAGTAAFLAGDVLFCRILRMTVSGWRLVAAALALATIPLGTAGSAVLQLAVLVAALGVCVACESSVNRTQADRFS